MSENLNFESSIKSKEKLFDGEFFAKLNILKLSTKLHFTEGMSGARKSSAKGSSVEFSDFREYILGDDIRRIDWNAYGRLDKLFIKQFMEEKEGLFNIYVDASKSMDFGKKNKSITALRIAGALSYIILNNLDRVYILTAKETGLTTTKGMTGRQSFSKIANELERIEFEGDTSLIKSIKSKPIKHKGVSIIISDFFENNEIEDVIKYLMYNKQEVILIQVLSREEVSPELEDTINLIDSETNDNMKITMTSQVLKAYKKTLNSFTNHLSAVAKKYGVTYIKAISDEPLDKVLLHIR